MALTDRDFELLECYLDDVLDLGEVDALQARLTDEPAFATALADVRARRAVRKAVFSGFEPTDAAATAIASRILKSTVAAPAAGARPRRLSPWHVGLAAAACLAVGFFGRGIYDRSLTTSPNLARQGGAGGVELKTVAAYQVTLRDETGKVVAVQRFDSLDKANEFAADFAHWQARSERLASGRFVLTADRF